MKSIRKKLKLIICGFLIFVSILIIEGDSKWQKFYGSILSC